jgi:DNA invertase Pin-like site-specific DNA recombinase
MNASDSIQMHHLKRRAMVYVRQSTPQQVVSRQESRRLQYALRNRAVDLGWHERDIEIVDIDLGQSGTTTEGRLGFQHLVSEVALGNIGVVIAYDATRLARNCSHWYQLLDLCGRTDCLIADRDGIYDPKSINGRLLLGLKGQISELELHTIQARLSAGRLCKAERGELKVNLPVGLIWLDNGRVAKHPNREVQERISLIFSSLLEMRSIGQLVRHLNKHGLKIPRNSPQTPDGVVWRRANSANVGSIVKNLAYTGTFAYGEKTVKIEGSVTDDPALAQGKLKVA